jgi:hypothetical protein
MILQRGVGSRASALWWLHRDARERVCVARVKVDGDQLRIHRDAPGQWVQLFPDGQFDRRALRNHFQDLRASQARLAPAVPQAYSLSDVQEMLRDPVRVARFIEWHYAPDEHMDRRRKLHEQLKRVTLKPGRMSVVDLAEKLKELLTALKESRREAKAALVDLYKDSKIGLTVTWEGGSWSRVAERKRVADELLAMAPGEPGAVFGVLKSIEDRARLRLKLPSARESSAPAPSTRVRAALKGLLLVIGARDLGPIILDAPGAYLQPAQLTETLAPLVLHARDRGAQFIASIDDTNLPFSVDADLLFVCSRATKEGRVGPLEDEATGPLENAATAAWALRNLDGGGDQFSRRMQLYLPVLGAELSERQRRLAEVVLALGTRRSRRDEGRGK